MDNITHSITGALTAKIFEAKSPAAEDQTREKRRIFWLLVLSANLPDIDILLGFLGDPMLSIKYHRGITHSILFAPIFALLPTFLFSRFGRRSDLKLLWFTSFIGISLHIFFDLITGFGTQIFAPFSDARYSLDWMFIIDPVFTGILGVVLFLGKIFRRKRGFFPIMSGIFVILYLGSEIFCHRLAYNRIEEALRRDGVLGERISVLPQPLSIFNWMGLVQTESGVMQTFLSVLEGSDSLEFKEYKSTRDSFVEEALQTAETKWYLRFARHPWIRSFRDGDQHVVEFRDLQFSIDEAILKSVGFTERSTPFVLRLTFNLDGELLETTFDRRRLEKEVN